MNVENEDSDSVGDDQDDYSKFGSKSTKKADKERRIRELEELKKNGLDNFEDQGAIRLPNRV